MDRATELSLIDELLALKARKSAFLDEAVETNPVDHYLNEERFQAEQKKLFQRFPNAAAHISELPDAGSFVRRSVGGLPVLITRDKEGAVNAFLNVCRHRGTRLVDDEKGCKHRFTCPYHAWTYSSSGDLVGAPHFDEGFPGYDKSDLSLVRLRCEERHGLIWVWQDPENKIDLGSFFEDLDQDFATLNIADMTVAAQSVETRKANWKILLEGGIEAYHFRVAHRATIGPHFEDNLSSYKNFGPHMRAVLPRTSMKSLTEQDRDTWRLRDHANVLYTFFPSNQFLVMQDHLVWIRSDPQSAGETTLHLSTLAPTSGPDAEGKDEAHWRRNHQITMMTLDEDFTIGDSMQSTLASGANQSMVFGRFEGALGQFNRTVETYLEQND